MNNDSEMCTFLSEIWEYFKDHVSDKKKEDVALGMIELFQAHDLIDDVKNLEEIYGVDNHLDSAINTLIELDDEEEIDDYDPEEY